MKCMLFKIKSTFYANAGHRSSLRTYNPQRHQNHLFPISTSHPLHFEVPKLCRLLFYLIYIVRYIKMSWHLYFFSTKCIFLQQLIILYSWKMRIYVKIIWMHSIKTIRTVQSNDIHIFIVLNTIGKIFSCKTKRYMYLRYVKKNQLPIIHNSLISKLKSVINYETCVFAGKQYNRIRQKDQKKILKNANHFFIYKS